MLKKKYVVEDDWATCTDGMIQQGILVKAQSTVKASAKSYNVWHPDEAEQDEKDKIAFLEKRELQKRYKAPDRTSESGLKLVATERDRFKQNFNCAKLINAAALVGTLVGAVVGAVMGGALGSGIGSAVGRKLFGPLGGIVGGVVGGIVGTVVGAVTGALAGSVVATQLAKKAINTFMPCFCYVLTYFSPWSSIHERSFPQMPRALMPDAQVNCLLGGIVSMTIPDMEMAIKCAKASMFIYCDPNEDEVRPKGTKMPGFIDDLLGKGDFYDSDGDNYGGQSHKDFDKYNPEHFGWKEVDSEFAARVAEDAGVPYETQVMLDKDGKPMVDENGNIIKHSNLYDDESGTKVAIYETPDGDIVMVSRGTHNHEGGRSTRDWIDDNGNQGLRGESDQYDNDAKIAKATRKQVDKKNAEEGTNRHLITTGHSMAGGKTTLSGATGRSDETYAFNPAGVDSDMYKKYGVSAEDAAHTIVFSAKNDFLTNMNDNVWIAPNHVGKRIVLDTGTDFFDVADSHDMIFLIEAMKKIPFIKVYALND